MNKGLCRFCGEEAWLVRAHIIPASLYPLDDSGSRRQIVLDGRGGEPPSMIQNGVYDPNLVCQECEGLFSEGDNYAKLLLVDGRDKGTRQNDKGSIYVEYPDLDYRRLKLFFASLLWRAHATSLSGFRHVTLGKKYERLVKEMIRTGKPGSADDFAVFIVRFADGPLGKLGSTPTPRRFHSVYTYEFLLFGYIAYVKVDQRPFPYPIRAAQLQPGRPLWMVEKAFEDTPFYKYALDAIQRGKTRR